MALLTLQNFYSATLTRNCIAGATNIYVSTKPTPTVGYLVISPGTESLREIIKYTATGTDGTGDYVTVTLANRGLGGTTDIAHTATETVRMNITAEHYADIETDLVSKVNTSYLDTDVTLAADSDVKIATQKATKAYADTKTSLTGDETITGVKTFSSSPIVPAPTTNLQAATKKYADDLAIAGSPDASTIVKGIVEEATQAEVDAGTAVGATSARLFVNPSTLTVPVASGAVASGSGTQTITHNLGRIPRAIRISGSGGGNNSAPAGRSHGFYTGSNNCMYTTAGNTSSANVSSTYAIRISTNTAGSESNVSSGVIGNLTTTFDIVWTGSTAGALVWEAQL